MVELGLCLKDGSYQILTFYYYFTSETYGWNRKKETVKVMKEYTIFKEIPVIELLLLAVEERNESEN